MAGAIPWVAELGDWIFDLGRWAGDLGAPMFATRRWVRDYPRADVLDALLGSRLPSRRCFGCAVGFATTLAPMLSMHRWVRDYRRADVLDAPLGR